MDEQRKLKQQLFNYAIVSLAQGKSTKSVIAELVEQGIPLVSAEKIVAQASDIKKREFRKGGMKTIGIGIGLLALGGVITAATYSTASPGGSYMVTTGLFVVGAITVLRGLWRSMAG